MTNRQIKSALRRKGWTAYRLAEECRPLSRSTVYRFLRGGRANAMTIARIREVLGI